MDRFHRRSSVAHGKKRESTGAGSSDAGSTQARNDAVDASDAGDDKARTIFFNLDLPDDAKGDDGRPRAAFERNKIRTAKYTPLSFVPKNLYFQFLNIANVYFLFIIILSVSAPPCFSHFPRRSPSCGLARIGLTGRRRRRRRRRRTIRSSFPYSGPRIRASTRSRSSSSSP